MNNRPFRLLTAATLALGLCMFASGQANDAAPRPAIPMPADFPKDVPLPKDAKPVEATTRKDGTRHLKLQTPNSYADVTAFYAKQLPAQGWEMGPHKDTGKAASFMGDKGERTLSLGVFERGGFRQITVEVDPPGRQ